MKIIDSKNENRDYDDDHYSVNDYFSRCNHDLRFECETKMNETNWDRINCKVIENNGKLIVFIKKYRLH